MSKRSSSAAKLNRPQAKARESTNDGNVDSVDTNNNNEENNNPTNDAQEVQDEEGGAVEQLLNGDFEAAINRSPTMTLEKLRHIQRKLAIIKLIVDDAARRAATPSSVLASLQLTVRAAARVYERSKVFKLTLDTASGDLQICDEPRDPRSTAARAAVAGAIVHNAARAAAQAQAAQAQASASANNAGDTSAAAAPPARDGGAGVHASNFVEIERVVDTQYVFGAAHVPVRAVVYYRRALTCETIHYRFWYGAESEQPTYDSTDTAIETTFALLQRPIATCADQRVLFEWLATRSFDNDGVRQVQYLPETLVRRQDGSLSVSRRPTSQFDPPSYSSQCVGQIAVTLAHIEALYADEEFLRAVVASQGAAVVGREFVIRALQLVQEMRVWSVLEQDIDACYGLAPTQQIVTHSARLKQAGATY